jgi:hypothetical protein
MTYVLIAKGSNCMHHILNRLVVVAVCLGGVPARAHPAAHRIVQLHLPAGAAAVSGRLLLFVAPAPKGALPDAVDVDEFEPATVHVAAQDISRLEPGGTAEVDADTEAYPNGLSQLKDGEYVAQAVLDTRHDYAYGGRAIGDVTSKVVRFKVTAGRSDLAAMDLSEAVPARDPWQLPARIPAAFRATVLAAKPYASAFNFQSAALSQFWGRPITMRGWVLTPPGYTPAQAERYPTVYWLHGYGGSYASVTRNIGLVNGPMVKGETPPMIWVFLDQSSPTGTHEFADSVNNGPWGLALTQELIPYLETQYRMDAKPTGRFLAGHSSGGWATLWLQTHYPAFFGGTWSTSPDPSDFHDFTGVDIYAPHANMYHRADGSAYPLVRMHGKVMATLQEVSQLEAVLGPAGGQMSSFDWVFSPRGADGRPAPMFDRASGDVDPVVASYWRDHFDIAHLVTEHWAELRGDLTGKIHVVVGDADTFYLDGPAHRLQRALDELHAGASFTYLPGRGHFDLYKKGSDDFGMLKDITWDIYAKARPGSTLRRPAEISGSK